MKLKARVWWIAWDTDKGTDCELFTTENDWFTRFREIILKDIDGIEDQEALEIRRHLNAVDIGSAYTVWQGKYKSELDTYNWGDEELEFELDPVQIETAR